MPKCLLTIAYCLKESKLCIIQFFLGYISKHMSLCHSLHHVTMIPTPSCQSRWSHCLCQMFPECQKWMPGFYFDHSAHHWQSAWPRSYTWLWLCWLLINIYKSIGLQCISYISTVIFLIKLQKSLNIWKKHYPISIYIYTSISADTNHLI